MAGNALARVQTVAPSAGLPASIRNHESPIIQHLAKQEAAIAPLLPAGVSFPRVIYDVVAALQKDEQQKKPALKHCTPASVFIAVVKIQAWGLQIGDTAHLVPFKDHCEAIRDYKGKIEQARRAGAITDAYAVVVYENEVAQGRFRYEMGMNPVLEHRPILDERSRGSIVGVYAIVEIRPGVKRPLYMTMGEVDKIRQAHSKQWKECAMPKWYMEKTVLHQALKAIPKNARVAQLADEIENDVLTIENEPALQQALGTGPTIVRDDDGTPLPVDTSTGELVGAKVETPETAGRDLEWARKFPLPWRNSPAHGTPIGEFSAKHLQKIAEWCEKRAEESGGELSQSNVDLYDATQLLLADIARQQVTLPIDDESDLPELALNDAPKGAPPGSLSYTPPKGGAVQDAFALGDQKAEPTKSNTNALAEP